jgi:hypothetical protein
VVITVADLLTGLYYFPIESVTGVDAPPATRGFDLAVRDRRTLSVMLLCLSACLLVSPQARQFLQR